MDKGRHAKYLITPPGYKEEIPDCYIHVPSSSYFISLIFRSIPAKGKTVADAHAYAHTLRMYSFSEEPNPKPTIFKDFTHDRFSSLPFYDERYFQDIYELFSVEPVDEKDKLMIGKLKTLGIERGKPFKPSEKQRKAMNHAAVDAYYYMFGLWFDADKSRYFWSDRRYVSQFLPDDNFTFSFDYGDSFDVDGRAFFNTIYIPNKVDKTPTNWYLAPLADKDGNGFQASKTYRVNVPPKVPVEQFWALTIYDKETSAFIYTESNRTTLSSYDLAKMKIGEDGSVDIYIGPNAPDGWESNWIPTGGKIPYPLFRFYGAKAGLHNKTFKLPDFELID